jgi:hypothetical protein
MLSNLFGRRTAVFRLVAVIVLTSVVVGVTSTQAGAVPAPSSRLLPTAGSRFVSFPSFISQLHGSNYSSRASEGISAVTSDAFAEMKAYLLNLYAGVRVTSSFTTDDSYVDCVTAVSQPSVSHLGLTHLAQPPKTRVSGAEHLQTTSGVDQKGQRISCPSGTIPMRRTTLQDIARFGTLHNFLAKNPVSGSATKSSRATSGYNWAYAYQSVTNFGGTSNLNTWDPKVTGGDDHSLSQQWIIGGSGGDTQTGEGGWIKSPTWGKHPVLFVYWTADDYQTTGCYNLTCAGFVQTDSGITLGEPFSPCCSKKGGTNDYFSQTYELSGGDWWFGIDGTWIGYFPTSIYKGGQLSINSDLFELGGEVYNDGGTWSQMGSVQFAKTGALQAAYQNDITYLNSSLQSENVALTPIATSPACYTIKYKAATSKAEAHFYFGGPGAASC